MLCFFFSSLLDFYFENMSQALVFIVSSTFLLAALVVVFGGTDPKYSLEETNAVSSPDPSSKYGITFDVSFVLN